MNNKSKMPNWFPFVLILMGFLELGSVFTDEITRNFLITSVGVVCWAILSTRKQ